MSKKLSYCIPALTMAGLIFYFSSLEKIDLPLKGFVFNDLLFHCAAYFLFGLAIFIAASPWNFQIDYPTITKIFLVGIGVIYGLSDEIHQSFVLNRSSTVSDFLADSFGVFLALGVKETWIWKRERLKVRVP